MPPKVQKSKEAKLLAAQSASRSKGKKKWNKGKVRDKADNAVVLEPALYDKIMKDVPKRARLITVNTLVENYKINASAARRVLHELREKGLVKAVSATGSILIFTKV